MDRGLVRLSSSEVRAATRAGYMTAPAGKKASILGGMFSWVNGLRLGAAGFLAGGATSKAPVNSVSSETGQTVTPDIALTLSAVWSCVWLNARTMASLPLDLKRYKQSGAAALAVEETLYDLLRWKPNADQSSFDFWCGMWAQEQLWGTGYAEKIRNGGKVIALQPLLSRFMTAYVTDKGRLRFRYDEPTKPRDFAADDLFRVFTRSLDGIVGCSVLEFARNSLGIARSGELSAAKTFRKGLNASGFLATKVFLTEAQREMFRDSVDEFTGESEKAGGTMVLEGDTDYKQLSLKPLDAELLSSRQFSVEDVCRWFGVPPILIGHASAGQTMWGSGVEQIFSGWSRLALRPYTTACTQRIRTDLLTVAERIELYAEYDLDDLLAADSLARSQLYASLSQNGIKTRNELREKEGLGPMAGGEMLTVQSNLVPLDKLGQVTAPGAPSQPAEKFRNALLELLALDPGQPPNGKEKPP
jgi:HK97 family phage portal protein